MFRLLALLAVCIGPASDHRKPPPERITYICIHSDPGRWCMDVYATDRKCFHRFVNTSHYLPLTDMEKNELSSAMYAEYGPFETKQGFVGVGWIEDRPYP